MLIFADLFVLAVFLLLLFSCRLLGKGWGKVGEKLGVVSYGLSINWFDGLIESDENGRNGRIHFY
jgi:hypothetical protein